MTSQQTKLISDYKKTHTLKETGEKFNLSSERIRQIGLQKNRKTCRVHNRFYYNKCSHCLAMSYDKLIKMSSYEFIRSQIEIEALNRKRDYLSTERRKVLIKVLFEKYKKSFSAIGSMLDRHHTSIISLYNQTTHDRATR